jgi:hypothetical protein
MVAISWNFFSFRTRLFELTTYLKREPSDETLFDPDILSCSVTLVVTASIFVEFLAIQDMLVRTDNLFVT